MYFLILKLLFCEACAASLEFLLFVDLLECLLTKFSVLVVVIHCGTWWLRGRFGALHPVGRRFEYPSSRHVGTLGKFFTRSCLLRFSVLTPTKYQCCSRPSLSARSTRHLRSA